MKTTKVTKMDKISLRPYQKSIVGQIAKSTGSVLVEVPTGGGKSVIASEITKNEIANGGKVLIVAPKIILLEQIQETFKEHKPQIIHGNKKYDKTHSVFISTLQTSHKQDLGFDPTMIIIDEVHFGFTGKMIQQLLEDFKGRLIGLSATPYDQNGNLIKGFSEHIDQFDLNFMLENKYLVYPRCYETVGVDLSGIKIQAGDYNQTDLDSRFNNFEYISQIVEKTKEQIKQQKSSLIFCINIAHSKAIAVAFTDAGIPTKAMHSQLSPYEKDTIMRDYKNGKIKMLANPMMLTTGFDDPKTDCIVLARPTKSQNLYRQMVGRGLRLAENKIEAKVLDCGGVIKDLGLPTEPIKTIFTQYSNKPTECKKCKSTVVYIKEDENGNLVRVCEKCGTTEDIKKQGCKCASCGLINGSEANYTMKENSLYMTCSRCKHGTLINSVSSYNDLLEILGEDKVRRTKERYCFDYMKALHGITGTFDINFREDVALHIKALSVYIDQNMEKFISYRSDEDSIKKAIHNIYYLKEDIPSDWNLAKYGRLFDLAFERELLA